MDPWPFLDLKHICRPLIVCSPWIAASSSGLPFDPILFARYPGLQAQSGLLFDPILFAGSLWIAIRSHIVKLCTPITSKHAERVSTKHGRRWKRHNLPDVEIDDIGELEMREYFEYRKWNVWVKKRVRWIRKVKKFLKYRRR